MHIPILKRIGRARIASLCDVNISKAKSLAEQYDIPKVYSDLSCMLRDEALDVIDVLTPPQSHALVATEALDAGCHVLIEKPMCITVDEADSMIEAAKGNGVKLGVVHSFLFNPAIQETLRILESGKVGRLLEVDVAVSLAPLLKHSHPKWMYDLPGGLFGEMIPHGLYVLLGFIGHVHRVKCITQGDSEANGLFPFTDLHVSVGGEKSIGTLYMSTRIASPYTVMAVKAVAEKGTLRISIPTATLIKTNFGSSTGLLSRASYNVNQAYQHLSACVALGLKTAIGNVKPQMTHETVLRGFLESVCRGTRPLVTVEDGREVVRAINMIWEQVLE